MRTRKDEAGIKTDGVKIRTDKRRARTDEDTEEERVAQEAIGEAAVPLTNAY